MASEPEPHSVMNEARSFFEGTTERPLDYVEALAWDLFEQFEALRRGLFELDRKADAGPVGVDISDYSDEFAAGFLAGQSNAIAEALLLAGGSSTTGVQGFPWAHPSPPAPNPAKRPT